MMNTMVCVMNTMVCGLKFCAPGQKPAIFVELVQCLNPDKGLLMRIDHTESRLFFLIILTTLLSSVAQGYAKQKIILSTGNPDGSLHVIAAKKFKELVEKDGRMTVELHYLNGPLPNIGGEEDNAKALKLGTGLPHVSIMAVNNTTIHSPINGFLTLPYLFPSVNDAKTLFNSEFMKMYINALMVQQGNYRALGWLIGGYRHLTNSKKPVTSLEDIKGLKIRTPGNPIMLKTYSSFGAIARPKKWADTFDALQSGEFDGQENPFSVILDMKFWNAGQKYITKNGTILWTGPILISEKFYQTLPLELRQVLTQAGEAAAKYEWDWISTQISGTQKTLESKGMKILELTDKPKWVTAARKIWPDFYAMIGSGNVVTGKKVVDQVVQIISGE